MKNHCYGWVVDLFVGMLTQNKICRHVFAPPLTVASIAEALVTSPLVCLWLILIPLSTFYSWRNSVAFFFLQELFCSDWQQLTIYFHLLLPVAREWNVLEAKPFASQTVSTDCVNIAAIFSAACVLDWHSALCYANQIFECVNALCTMFFCKILERGVHGFWMNVLCICLQPTGILFYHTLVLINRWWPQG
jgi:hypothetical protein